MKIEKMHNKIRYTLTNDNLVCGDKVYPIANGRCLDDGSFILHDFDFSMSCSGFPDKSHTILDLQYSKSKPYEVRTNKGFSPVECYYKIIKMEKQVEKLNGKLLCTEWIECE